MSQQEILLSNKSVVTEFTTSEPVGNELSSNIENDCNVLNIQKPVSSKNPAQKISYENEQVVDQVLDSLDSTESEPADDRSVNKNINTNHNYFDESQELYRNNDLQNEAIELGTPRSDAECETRSSFYDDKNNASLSEQEDEIQTKKRTKKFVMDSESEDELTVTAGKSNKIKADIVSQESQNIMSTLTALWDSESSEGEFDADDRVQSEVRIKELPKFKSAVKQKVPKKMTAKVALQQRQEIKSESQRMLRETPISLPYHKPKEHSIREFLKNRPRLSQLKSVQDAPASAAIKMTTEELKLVTKKMKEREKELQKFYKSESESEEEISKEESEAIDVAAILPSDTTETNDDICKFDVKISASAEVTENDNVEVDKSIHISILGDKEIGNNSENCDVSPANVEEPIETGEVNSLVVQEVINSNVSIEDEHKESEAIHTNANSNLFIENSSKESEDIRQNETSNKLTEDEEMITNGGIEKSFGSLCEEENRKCENIASTDANKGQGKIIIHSMITIPKKSIYELEESMDFDFNLDGIEEIPKNNSTAPLGNDDNANADCIDVLKSCKQELLKQFGNYTPCLSGDPDCEIDLDGGMHESNDVIQFIERFKKQVEVKTVPKNKAKLDIINLTQGKVHNESIIVPTDDKEEPVNATDKPALRKQILKNELQEQIAQQRVELWKQKQRAFEEMTRTNEEDSQVKSDYEDNVLDNDDEEEEENEQLIDDIVSDDEDDDEQEDAKSSKIKSTFLDGEAEVTDDDEELESDDMEADDENAEDDVSCDSKSTAQDDNTVTCEPKKTLKRIIKVFPDDSDEEDLLKELPSDKIDSLFVEDDDDVHIPPYQPRPDKTPHREMNQSKSDITFHSPITQLSALEGLNSGSKFLHESPVSPFPFPPATPPVDTQSVKQKLFSDSCDVFQPETNTQELIGLCSGDFSLTNTEEPDPLKSTQACTQDLLSICSGSFSELTNAKTDSDIIKPSNEDNNVEIETELTNKSNSILQSKYLDEDRLISQLLDEEEMEKFKKKFESPITNTCNTSNINDSNSQIKGGGRLVFDSSDDEQEENNPTIKPNKQKKLYFSDDDSEKEEEEKVESEEDIDLHDIVEDTEDFQNKEIDYDSEENEIEVLTVKHKPTDFFEKEAELSESDWDSADEDERGLDELEQEQGDNEVFDENKIRNDLERIHMRNVLDQDNREIKILQELLLEDGELHGTGRQRQFRWRNIDDNANDDKGPVNGDDMYLDEDESEEHWRKQKHEREMFLKSQQDKQDEDIDSILSDSNSQVLKIGQDVLRRSVSNSSGQSDKDKIVSSSEVNRKTSIQSNTRGSFLARSNNFLTRLADITKINNATNVIKTSTKIVFQTSTSLDDNLESNKRKADDGTPIAIKKLRLSSNISPSLKGLERKKKLF